LRIGDWYRFSSLKTYDHDVELAEKLVGQDRDPTANKRVLFIDAVVVLENGRAVRLSE
jgi:hypothetical protein